MTKLLKKLALVAVLAVSANGASANHYTYSEGTWAVAARAGIAPATFSRDADFTTVFADVPAVAATTSTTTVKKSFNQLYNVPFFAGADVGYFVCDNWEVFVNFDFDHACNDKFGYTQTFLGQPVTVDWTVRDRTGYAGYIGSRWYFCGFDCILPFVGAKLGVKGDSYCGGHESIRADGSAGVILENRRTKKDCASFAGGLQLGFDWAFDDCYALTFMSEMIGVAGKHFDTSVQDHSNNNTARSNGFTFTSQVSKNPRGYLSFPLTIGLRVRM